MYIMTTLSAFAVLTSLSTSAFAADSIRPQPRPEAVVQYTNELGDWAIVIFRMDEEGQEVRSSGEPICSSGARVVASFAGQLENGDIFIGKKRADASLLKQKLSVDYTGGAWPDHAEDILFSKDGAAFLGAPFLKRVR